MKATCFHVALEEYESKHDGSYRLHTVPQPLILSAQTPQQLLVACEETLRMLQSDTDDEHYTELGASSKSPEIPADLARVMAPIGLDIGGRTPEETAISVCAEIIALHSGRIAPSLRDAEGDIHRSTS